MRAPHPGRTGSLEDKAFPHILDSFPELLLPRSHSCQAWNTWTRPTYLFCFIRD